MPANLHGIFKSMFYTNPKEKILLIYFLYERKYASTNFPKTRIPGENKIRAARPSLRLSDQTD